MLLLVAAFVPLLTTGGSAEGRTAVAGSAAAAGTVPAHSPPTGYEAADVRPAQTLGLLQALCLSPTCVDMRQQRFTARQHMRRRLLASSSAAALPRQGVMKGALKESPPPLLLQQGHGGRPGHSQEEAHPTQEHPHKEQHKDDQHKEPHPSSSAGDTLLHRLTSHVGQHPHDAATTSASTSAPTSTSASSSSATGHDDRHHTTSPSHNPPHHNRNRNHNRNSHNSHRNTASSFPPPSSASSSTNVSSAAAAAASKAHRGWGHHRAAPCRVGLHRQPPFAYLPPGTIRAGAMVGFAVDLWRNVERRLGITCTYELGAFHSLVKQLERGEIDAIVSGVFIHYGGKGVAGGPSGGGRAGAGAGTARSSDAELSEGDDTETLSGDNNDTDATGAGDDADVAPQYVTLFTTAFWYSGLRIITPATIDYSSALGTTSLWHTLLFVVLLVILSGHIYYLLERETRAEEVSREKAQVSRVSTIFTYFSLYSVYVQCEVFATLEGEGEPCVYWGLLGAKSARGARVGRSHHYSFEA